jgi:hypothetical protein
LYFAVFSVMPLSEIHIEDQMGTFGYVLDHSGSERRSFLVLLHQLLSSNFRNSPDHTLSPHNDSLKRGAGSKPCSDNALSNFVTAEFICPEALFSLPRLSLIYHFMRSPGPKPSTGFTSFSSGLSPPCS